MYINGNKLTSKENRTPPIGEPNATATPAAQAADNISRILARERKYKQYFNRKLKCNLRDLTFIPFVFSKNSRHNISHTCCCMH